MTFAANGFRALLRAELARRRWFFAAAVALGLGGPLLASLSLSLVGSTRPSAYMLATGLVTPAWTDLLALLAVAFGLWLATDAFPRQRDRGGDRFLAALPIAPFAVFAARVLACGAVVVVSVLVRHGAYALQHAWAGDWPHGLAAQALALGVADAFGALVTLGVAFAVAHWRRVGWIALGVAFLLVRALAQHGVVDPDVDLLRFASSGLSASVALGWAGASVVSVGWAYAAFRGRRDRLGVLDRISRRGVVVPRLVTLLLALLVCAVPAVVLGPVAEVGPAFPAYPTATVTTSTRHYRFRYPARLAATLRPLLGEADGLYRRVAGELGFDEAGPSARLHVEVGEGGLGEGPGARAFALAQLTCARLIGPRTDGRVGAWSRATRTFEVGLCRDVALRVTGRDPFPARFEAAVLHSRRPVRVEELLDRRVLARYRGDDAAEPLGQALAVALRLEAGGISRVLDALRALASRPAPASYEASHALWSDWAKAAGVDLARLEERVLEVIEEGIGDDPRAHVALPRLDAVVENADSLIAWRVLAVPDQDVPPGWFVVCRARNSDPSRGGTSPVRAQRLGPDARGCQVFLVRSSPLEGGPWVQLGLRAVEALPALGTIWEDWTAPSGTP